MRHIALLRGVNVGGSGRLPMAEFREMLAGLGLTNVQTYIQSGNAVFDSALSPETIALKISDAIEGKFGFRRPVVMRDPDALQELLDCHPFQRAAEDHLHFFFCTHDQSSLDPALLNAAKGPQEDWAVMGCDIALHAPLGLARSKLAECLPRVITGDVTARNLRSTRAILALALTNP